MYMAMGMSAKMADTTTAKPAPNDLMMGVYALWFKPKV
jgi:hypothetical protein